jgi:hypothetical protein
MGDDKKKMKDKRVAGEGVGDPTYYNDQVGTTQEPQKASMEKKGRK